MTDRSVSKIMTVAAIAVLFLSIVACNDNETNISTPTVADVSMELVPTEGPTEASTDPAYEWMVSLDVVITEHGGKLGLNIDQIVADLEEAQGGISVGSQDGDIKNLVLDVPANRVEAGESLTIGLDLFYTFESGGRESLVDIGIGIVDDNGSVLVGVAQFHGLP